jgi:hypothetical protein
VEAAARVALLDDRLSVYANYALARATFQSPAEIFSARSDNRFAASPLAGPNRVQAGDRIPMVPERQVKAGVDATLPMGITLGTDARYTGQQWLRGDEANETQPLESYLITTARLGVDRGAWVLTVAVDNVFDTRRATFGTFNENRRTGALERFLTPTAARSVVIGLRRRFGT